MKKKFISTIVAAMLLSSYAAVNVTAADPITIAGNGITTTIELEDSNITVTAVSTTTGNVLATSPGTAQSTTSTTGGSPSGDYLFYNAGGNGVLEVPVTVAQNGYYSVDLHAFTNASFGAKITVGSTDTALTKGSTILYTINGNRNVVNYTGSIYLSTDITSISITLLKGNSNLVYIADCIDLKCTRPSVTADGATATIEDTAMTFTGNDRDPGSVTSGTVSGGSYAYKSRSSDSTVTIPVHVEQEGFYSVNLHAYKNSGYALSTTAGSYTKELSNGNTHYFTVTDNSEREVTNFTGNIYLNPDIDSITVTFRKGGSTLLYIVDCIDLTYIGAYLVEEFDEVENVVTYDDVTNTYSKAFELGAIDLSDYNTFFVAIGNDVKGQSLSTLGLDGYDGSVILGIIITNLPSNDPVKVGFTTETID